MRTTITAFAIALTMTAAAQPQRIIEGQRTFFALMMSSKGVTIYCGTEE